MKKTPTTTIMDSRHLKVLVAKKELLQDSVVVLCLDEDKYGTVDVSQLQKVAEVLQQLAPDSIFFTAVKKMDLAFWDKAQFRNKDIIITIGHENEDQVDTNEVERLFTQCLEAKSIRFVHKPARIVISGKED